MHGQPASRRGATILSLDGGDLGAPSEADSLDELEHVSRSLYKSRDAAGGSLTPTSSRPHRRASSSPLPRRLSQGRPSLSPEPHRRSPSLSLSPRPYTSLSEEALGLFSRRRFLPSSPFHAPPREPGLAVTVRDLCYACPANAGRDRKNDVRRVLLHDISFEAAPQTLTAILGPSGASKTTLLDVLAHRKMNGSICGEILFDGKSRRPKDFLNKCAYIQQDDLHPAELTVREVLNFSALLRIPRASRAERAARVGYIITQLSLQDCAETRVGSALERGISGGELKRLSIAVELVRDTPLLLLDEPTSGLDSGGALQVVVALRRVTRGPVARTLIATIHQPAPEAFSMFDQVLLLSKGHLIYAGRADEAAAYFSSPPLFYKQAQGQSVPEFILAVASCEEAPAGVNRGPARDPLPCDELASAFRESVNAGFMDSSMSGGVGRLWLNPGDFSSELSHRSLSVRSDDEFADGDDLGRKGRSAAERLALWSSLVRGQVGLLCVVMMRSWLIMIRNKHVLHAILVKNFAVGVLGAVVFWGQGRLSPSDALIDPLTGVISAKANNALSLNFFAIVYAATGHLQAVPALLEGMHIFERERSAGLYGTWIHWLVSSTIHLPILTGSFAVYLNITYWPAGLAAHGFGYFFILMLVGTLIGFTMAQALTAAFKDASIVLSLWPMCFIVLTNFSGYAVTLPHISPVWRWVADVSFIRWLFQGSFLNMFKGFQEEPELARAYSFDSRSQRDCLLFSMLFYVGTLLALLLLLQKPRSRLLRVARSVIAGMERVERLRGVSDATSASSTAANVSTLMAMAKRGAREAEGADDGDLEAPLLAESGEDYQRCAAEAGPEVSLYTSAPCTLLFSDVSYWVKGQTREQDIQVLKGASGRAEPGKITAILGRSGAGKTTLLDLLVGNKSGRWGRMEGSIVLKTTVEKISAVNCPAYIMQDNVHIPVLTVRETLQYAAALRMGAAIALSEREVRITALLSAMRLTHVQSSLVGDSSERSLSGGELKRLSIAVEMVCLPSCIFLDEPTTGLDSQTALVIVQALKSLADQGRTVVCTVHAPSAEMWGLFDDILLLAEGRTVYYGPAEGAVDQLATPRSTFLPPFLKVGANPADYAMSAVTEASRAVGGIDELAQACVDMPWWKEIRHEQNNGGGQGGTRLILGLSRWGRSSSTSIVQQTAVLSRRGMLKECRKRGRIIASLLQRMFVGIFYGALWFQLGVDGLYERFSLLFFSLVFICMGNQQSIPTIFEERLLFIRERSAGACGCWAYWMSSFLVALPFSLLYSGTYCVIVYWLVGLNSSTPWQFAFFLLTIWLSDLAALSFCQALASRAKTQQAAIALFPISLFFFMAFAGFIIRIPTLPDYLRSWAPRVGFLRWALQGLIINEFEGQEDTFFPQPPGSPFTSHDAYEALLDAFGYSGTSKWAAIPVLLLSIATFRIVLLLSLRFLDWERR